MPNRDELITFYYNRYIVSGKTKTLPFLTNQWVEELLTQYTAALQAFGINVEQALVLLEASRPREARLVLEKLQ